MRRSHAVVVNTGDVRRIEQALSPTWSAAAFWLDEESFLFIGIGLESSYLLQPHND